MTLADLVELGVVKAVFVALATPIAYKARRRVLARQARALPSAPLIS